MDADLRWYEYMVRECSFVSQSDRNDFESDREN